MATDDVHEEPIYDALLQYDEDEASLDCGCLLRREFDDGSISILFCDTHRQANPYGPAYDSAGYDALLQPEEDEASLDCGCVLRREFGDGSASISFCSAHAALSPWRAG